MYEGRLVDVSELNGLWASAWIEFQKIKATGRFQNANCVVEMEGDRVSVENYS